MRENIEYTLCKLYDISYNEETNELQLMAAGNAVGTKVVVKANADLKDGIPVVDLNDYAGEDTNPDDYDNDVVEF